MRNCCSSAGILSYSVDRNFVSRFRLSASALAQLKTTDILVLYIQIFRCESSALGGSPYMWSLAANEKSIVAGGVIS